MKCAIHALEKNKFYNALRKELIDKLIQLYELCENKEAIKFWEDRK